MRMCDKTDEIIALDAYFNVRADGVKRVSSLPHSSTQHCVFLTSAKVRPEGGDRKGGRDRWWSCDRETFS